MATEVMMPRLGEGVIEGTIARWLKQECDAVAQYEPILEIETDKVTTEATAEEAGTLLKILYAEGDTVPVDSVIAYIGAAGETVAGAQEENGGPQPAAATGVEAPQAAAPAAAAPHRDGLGRISPVVARIAAEHGVELQQVAGTGRGGRITKRDILAYVDQRQATPAPPMPGAAAGAQPTAPAVVEPAGEGELQPLSNIRRAIAAHMVHSKQTSPHVTTVFEADFSRVAADRKSQQASFERDGVRLTFTAYIVSAIAQALKEHPNVNSSWHDDGILLRREINIGMATALDEGLIVPVIKGADGLSLLGLARAIGDLAERARLGRLRPDEVQSGTFTLTNHGVSGSLFATPIINQPQCGILGVGKIEKRVRVINDAIAIRPLAYLSFTFDHRILDGATADRFVADVVGIVENWP